MNTNQQPEQPPIQIRKEPHRIRIPQFLTDGEEVGLGDVVKKATSIVGIQPCGGCSKRARQLNNWMVFSAQPSMNTKE
ncbi:MAG: hypothetical protein M3460_30485 [Actinomycetota bacterium]|nr:hypothetical protein [Actinomycetota bacterium]